MHLQRLVKDIFSEIMTFYMRFFHLRHISSERCNIFTYRKLVNNTGFFFKISFNLCNSYKKKIRDVNEYFKKKLYCVSYLIISVFLLQNPPRILQNCLEAH